MAPKYKLTYFDLQGRGEAIRLIFKHANIDFDDHRISFETFGAMKENQTECPAGFLPMVTVEDKKLCQTVAIVRFLGNEFNMYGSNNIEHAMIDSLLDTYKDLVDGVIKVVFFTPADQKEEETKKLIEKFRKDLKYGEYLAKENGSKDVHIGTKITIADIYFFALMDLTNQALPQNNILDAFPILKNIDEKTGASDNIKNYLAERK